MDADTYQAGFQVDTAGKSNLTTERYLLTLKQDLDDTWSITNEELKDTYKGLYRSVYDKEQCFAFDSFPWHREGLVVKATNGSMCRGIRDKPARFAAQLGRIPLV